MDYKLNNINLGTFGLIPGQASGTNMAIAGAWDMPARIGKTFHDWGSGAKGMEPYVLAEEIRFGGRDIDFVALMETTSEIEALQTCFGLYEAIDDFNSLVPFETDLGIWNVYVKDEIQAEYIGDGWCKLQLKFRQPIIDLVGVLPKNKPTFYPASIGTNGYLSNSQGNPIYIGKINNDGYGIDGVMFEHLGLIVLSMSNYLNRPAAKTGQFTAYSNEGYKVSKTGFREITIKALIVQPTYQDFLNVVSGLYAIFSKPGLRYITQKNDALRDFFVKDGFQITNFKKCEGEVLALFNIKLTEVNAYTDWGVLTDSSNQELITELGNIIITK